MKTILKEGSTFLFSANLSCIRLITARSINDQTSQVLTKVHVEVYSRDKAAQRKDAREHLLGIETAPKSFGLRETQLTQTLNVVQETVLLIK